MRNLRFAIQDRAEIPGWSDDVDVRLVEVRRLDGRFFHRLEVSPVSGNPNELLPKREIGILLTE